MVPRDRVRMSIIHKFVIGQPGKSCRMDNRTLGLSVSRTSLEANDVLKVLITPHSDELVYIDQIVIDDNRFVEEHPIKAALCHSGEASVPPDVCYNGKRIGGGSTTFKEISAFFPVGRDSKCFSMIRGEVHYSIQTDN